VFKNKLIKKLMIKCHEKIGLKDKLKDENNKARPK